jgi:hypothetical protein
MKPIHLMAVILVASGASAAACGSTSERAVPPDAGGAGGEAVTEPPGDGGSTSASPSGGSPSVEQPAGGAMTEGGSGGEGGKSDQVDQAGAGGEAVQGGAAHGGAAGAGGEGAAGNPACESTPLDAALTSHLRITADNECEVFVNGASVGTTASWPSPVTIDVSLFIHPSKKNVIAIRGTNTSSQGGNDRGIIGELTLDSEGENVELVVTDASWRVSSVEEAGWSSVAFDASSWIAATEVANHGDPPWSALLGSTTAKWIWAAPVPSDTSAKPNLETTYARREFYFSFDGTTPVNEPGCP